MPAHSDYMWKLNRMTMAHQACRGTDEQRKAYGAAIAALAKRTGLFDFHDETNLRKWCQIGLIDAQETALQYATDKGVDPDQIRTIHLLVFGHAT